MNVRNAALPERQTSSYERLMPERLRRFLAVDETDIDYTGDVNAAVLYGARRNSHLILWAAALFVVVALVWAGFARLDVVTTGQGKVIPSAKVQVIQNLEGGIVSEILVKEGQVVEKDQPLLRLDDTRFSSNFRESRSKYLSLQAKAERLAAEAEGRAFTAPAEVQKEQPQLARDEQALYASRQHELQSNVSILKQQEAQSQQELSELKARREQLRRSHELVRRELVMSEPLVKDGAISEVELLRLKRSVNDLKGELDTTALSIPRAEAALDEVRRKIDDLGISFRTKAMAELNETRAELAAMTESIGAIEDRVSRTVVRSPVKGTVKQLKVSTIGGVVQPGMDLLEIVPLEGSLLVEARIRPADIAFLHPDQDAVVKLTAYDFSIYGGLPAKLEHISADTITDERGESFYVIRVRTEQGYLGSEQEPLKIIPGMTAVVDILTGHKTVLEYLLKPVIKAKERALRER